MVRGVDNVVVTFESVRVTEWNGSSVDSRRVGTVRVVATANRARCFLGAGREREKERMSGQRDEETDRPNTRAFSRRPRYAYAR